MTETQLEQHRTVLRDRRRALLESFRRIGEGIEALRSADRDPEFEEGAQLDHESFTLSRVGEAQRRELGQIDAALTRVDAGDYGVCRDCENDIDPRRLKALPYALLCTECAERREQSLAPAAEPPTM
ncbi:MAG: TraR/DksA C4-type zinc finger protein [Anaeromyxobacteraceae bacterium]